MTRFSLNRRKEMALRGTGKPQDAGYVLDGISPSSNWARRKARNSSAMITGVKFDAHIIAPDAARSNTDGAGAREWVQHQITGFAKCFNQWRQYRQGLLRRVKSVVGVGGPRNDIGDAFGALGGIALDQQMSAFMLVEYVAAPRGVVLRKHEMPRHAETSRAISCHEAVHVRPAVETDAETVQLEHAVHLGIGRLQPCEIVVVRNSPAVTGFVARDIRRVRQHEVHAAGVKLRQDVDAVAVKDSVARRVHGDAPIIASARARTVASSISSSWVYGQ